MTRFLRSILRFFCACMLLFLTVVCLTALVQLPLGFDDKYVVIPLAGGFAGGLIFFVFVNRLSFFYVFGHELTHWFVAKCFLRETGQMEVRGTGGHVQVERPNVWIVLAPYFIPLYALVWTGGYGVLQMIWRDAPGWITPVFNLGLGISYAFHVRMTVFALSRAQADLQVKGKFFSLSLILCCNAALVLLCLIVAGGQWGRGWTLFWHYFTMYTRFILRIFMNTIAWLMALKQK